MNQYLNANAVLSVFAKNYMELKKGLPIRPSEMSVLNIITETEGQYTPVKLADLLGVSKQMITTHISSLESKGYISKEPCSQDKRAYYILPTDKGVELVRWAESDLNGKLEQLMDGLGLENFNTLVELAERANKIMKANRRKEE